MRRIFKNTTASKNPPGSALGILATLQSVQPEVLSRVASAILGNRRAGTYLSRFDCGWMWMDVDAQMLSSTSHSRPQLNGTEPQGALLNTIGHRSMDHLCSDESAKTRTKAASKSVGAITCKRLRPQSAVVESHAAGNTNPSRPFALCHPCRTTVATDCLPTSRRPLAISCFPLGFCSGLPSI